MDLACSRTEVVAVVMLVCSIAIWIVLGGLAVFG